jgi:hypothetical protein
MSVDSHTRQQPTPAPPARSGFNPLTLVIASLSAVVAAVVVSKVWSGGTLVATAMTPVIVTLVKEALERPASRLEVGVSRLSTVRREDPDAIVVEEIEPGPEPGEVRVYGARGHKWKLALVTGLLAAVVAVAALTVPELVTGRSIVSPGKKTTAFGGHRDRTPAKDTQKTTTTETVTQTVPTETQTTPTVTETTPTVTETTPTTPPTTPTAPSGGQTAPVPPAETQPPPPQP